MSTEYCADLVTDAAEWERFFYRVVHPHMTQSWAWGEAKQKAAGWRTRRVIFDVGGWRPRRLLISRRGEPVAICQVLDKCPACVAMASRLNRGPLFLGADPGQDVIRGVYCRRRLNTEHSAPVEI